LGPGTGEGEFRGGRQLGAGREAFAVVRAHTPGVRVVAADNVVTPSRAPKKAPPVALRRVDHKRIVHPALGVIELDCHSLFSEDGRQRLLWFTAPPGTQGAAQPELPSSACRTWRRARAHSARERA
jgi:transcription regulator MmyB-like protein